MSVKNATYYITDQFSDKVCNEGITKAICFTVFLCMYLRPQYSTCNTVLFHSTLHVTVFLRINLVNL